jgi:hypothetical protein
MTDAPPVDPARRAELVDKLESLRPDADRPDGADDDRPLTQADVSGVLHLALERLDEARAQTTEDLHAAIARLKRSTEETAAVAGRLSSRPPPAPGK